MGYAGNFLKKHGRLTTINRMTPETAYISLKRSTKAIYSPSAREAMFEGLIEAKSNLLSGETFSIDTNTYITQTADYDTASKEIIVFAVRANAFVSISYETEAPDENFNLIKTWVPIALNIPVYKEVITRAQRQFDVGLLDNTIYMVLISKTIEIREMYRISFEGKNYKVESIDENGLEGVYKIQLSKDTRS